MSDWKFNKEKDALTLDKVPKNVLRLTATRLGAVLSMNPYSSDFRAWCEITRTWKEPFVDNKYTIAGKVIEPIIIDWCKGKFGQGVVSPDDFYGNDIEAFRYNFYKDKSKVFGGMWDAKITNKMDKVFAVIEIKTSGRPQDWVDHVPYEKLVQALMYGHLEHASTTYVAVAFMTDRDYAHPENFVVKENENFKLIPFDTETTLVPFDGEMCTISELMEYAEQWWNAYVITGLSPKFDETVDKEILDELRLQKPDETDDSLVKIMLNVEELEFQIEKIKTDNNLAELEKQVKNGKDAIKREMTKLLDTDSNKIQIGKWALSQTEKTGIDKKALKKDGLLDKYSTTSVSYTLRKSTKEDEDADN